MKRLGISEKLDVVKKKKDALQDWLVEKATEIGEKTSDLVYTIRSGKDSAKRKLKRLKENKITAV